jgi:hypothetical protein
MQLMIPVDRAGTDVLCCSLFQTAPATGYSMDEDGRGGRPPVTTPAGDGASARRRAVATGRLDDWWDPAWDTTWWDPAWLPPGAPSLDIYLIPFGNPGHPIVLKHAEYGEVYSYMPVSVGQYTVAMRPVGAPASSFPIVSANFMVSAGANYTVASLGPLPDAGWRC